ncbi:MAG: LysR family transcriptional regulator [Maricaulaceae bacterium]|jgi:DNA-binding transcriptional LysR family regulator
MDWDKLKAFHAAAEAGSLTSAADHLDRSQSAISRQIAALEAQLGVALFHRHARGLQLTEQGRILQQTTHDIAARVALAEATLQDSREKPQGELRISAPVALGSSWLVPRLKPFMRAYPEIRLQLILDDGETDLSSLEVEAALRLWRPSRADLIQRKLMAVTQHLYASPEYIKAHGAPQRLEDLDNHRLIVYGVESSTPLKEIDWAVWAGNGHSARKPALRVNTVLGVKRAIEAGLGVGSLPDYLAEGSNQIVRVMPGVEGPEFAVYYVYPEELRGSQRIVVFGEFLQREVRRLPA